MVGVIKTRIILLILIILLPLFPVAYAQNSTDELSLLWKYQVGTTYLTGKSPTIANLVVDMEMSGDQSTIVALSDAHDVFVWDIYGNSLWRTRIGDPYKSSGSFNVVATSYDGSIIAVVLEQSQCLNVYNKMGQLLWSRQYPRGGNLDVFVSEDGSLIVVMSSSSTDAYDRSGIKLWSQRGFEGGSMAADGTLFVCDVANPLILNDAGNNSILAIGSDGRVIWENVLDKKINRYKVWVSRDKSTVLVSVYGAPSLTYIYDGAGNKLAEAPSYPDMDISLTDDGSRGCVSGRHTVFAFDRYGNVLWTYEPEVLSSTLDIYNAAISGDGSAVVVTRSWANLSLFDRSGNLHVTYKSLDDRGLMSQTIEKSRAILKGDGPYVAYHDAGYVYVFKNNMPRTPAPSTSSAIGNNSPGQGAGLGNPVPKVCGIMALIPIISVIIAYRGARKK